MNETNKDLMERLLENRTKAALSHDENSEEAKLAFKEAMEASDRLLELEKIQNAQKEQKENRLIKVAEVAVVPLVLFGLTYAKDWKFTKELCKFEQTDSFSNTPARIHIKKVFDKFRVK